MSVEAVAVLEIEGKQFPLKAGRNYLVGRKTATENAAQLDIELECQMLDAKHALIRVSDDETKIHDLYSKLGTFLNKQRLDSLNEATLTTTGSIQLGELVGSIQFNATLESHDSSGFHDGPKNSSDIICSSPEPIAHSSSRLKHIQKNSLTSTPNDKQLQPNDIDHTNTKCKFLVPPVPQRKSGVANTSHLNLTKPDTTQSSFNSSHGNKTIDSFYIPETQQCVVRASLGSDSSRELSVADSDAGADDMINSRDSANDHDNDFCIPETQEVVVPAFSSSQARKHYQAERAMLEANMPANIFAEEDENSSASVDGSQFRICTQDFNEVDCFGDDDSNSSDLLAAAPCSIVIPRIQHDAVMLNNSGKVLPSDTKQQTTTAEEIVEEKEMSALQWSEQGSRCSTLQNEASHRQGSCTPEFFDLPKEAQQLAKDVNDIKCVPSNIMKSTVPVELPSTSSFKAPSNPVIKVSEPKLFEDDDDLLPTQVFSAKTGDTKKATAGKCSPEYLTLSDKENILPAAAAILEAVDFMEATQLFDASNLNVGCNREDEQLTPPVATAIITTTTTAAESTSNATSITEPEPKAAEDDDDLLPTQIFPSTKSKAATDMKTPAASKKFLSSTLQTTSEGGASDATAFFGKMHQLTPPIVAGDFPNFPKHLGALSKKSSTLSNVSMSESPDIDLLLCTPQIIAENFVKPDQKAKKNLIAKQKTLFGDDSDEESDVLELINAPKVSHDFDKLLPHLKKQQLSPKCEEVESKLHHYNRSFGEKDDVNSKLKVDKKITTRSRDDRHCARDKEREKKGDNPSKMQKKTEESKKQTRSRAASKLHSEKTDVETAKKPDRKRRSVETLKIETAEKIMKKIDKKDETELAKPATETKEVGRAKPEKISQKKKDVKSETEKPKKVSTAKLKQEAKVSKVQETTTRRTTRSRSESQTSNSENPVELPPRRMTRLKSRIEEDPPIEPKTSTSVEARKNTRRKKTDVLDKNGEQDAGPKELLKKSKKPSTSSSSQDSKNSQDAKSDESGTSMEQKRKRLRSTSSLGSAHCSTTFTTTTPDTASDAQKLRQNKKIQVSMTMVDPEHFQNLAKNSPDIWTVAQDPMESDILIMDKGNRTFKFLIAMAKGIPIVKSSWLEIVNKNRQITSMTEHLYTDEAFEKRHKFSLLKSIQMARKQKLFADYHFLMTPGIRPQPDELEAIIKCAGGTVHINVPAGIKDNQKLYLVTSKDDQKLWHKYRRLNNKIIIISSEGVMAAVMRQIVKPLDTNLLA